MTATIHPPLTALPEQRLILPLAMTWEQFKALDSLLEYTRSVRLSYLDGYVEIMTRSPEHETIKCVLAGMLCQFFLEKDMSFRPTGSATLQGETKGSRFILLLWRRPAEARNTRFGDRSCFYQRDY